MAKESLMDPVDIHEPANGFSTRAEELRLEIMEAVNKLGIGAQGLGGLTVLDVKIMDYPSRRLATCAMIPNCAAAARAL